MKMSQVPCQAVYNKLFVDDIPYEISCLNQWELFLVYKRFLFKKILIMLKSQAPKPYGVIINVPVDVNKIHSLLPNAENVIMVKLKKKSFKSHVFLSRSSWKDLCGINLFKI